MRDNTSSIGRLALVVALSLTTSACMPYLYTDRGDALIPGLDVDRTLDVAEQGLDRGETSSILVVWAIRDQPVTPDQASRISDLYFRMIDSVARQSDFHMWHLTWAIGNLYRFGGDDVRRALRPAYLDADGRVDDLNMRIATQHFRGDQIYSGDAHIIGHTFARSHLVVPGDLRYRQTVDGEEPRWSATARRDHGL